MHRTKEQIECHHFVCQQGIARLQAALSWLESVPLLGDADMYEIGYAVDSVKDSINRRKAGIKQD
jgi:hypothetical protein